MLICDARYTVYDAYITVYDAYITAYDAYITVYDAYITAYDAYFIDPWAPPVTHVDVTDPLLQSALVRRTVIKGDVFTIFSPPVLQGQQSSQREQHCRTEPQTHRRTSIGASPTDSMAWW
jgi:hypothetical protein